MRRNIAIGTSSMRSAALDVGQHGQVIQALLLAMGDHATQCARSQVHVGIAEEQPLAGGELRPAVQRVNLAQPAGRQLVNVQHAQPVVARRELIGQCTGVVGRAVIDQDELDLGIAFVEAQTSTPGQAAPPRYRPG